MKTAISNIAWTEQEDAIAAESMQGGGVGGLEVAPSRLWSDPLSVTDAQVSACLDFWRRHGIRIVAMQALLFGQPQLRLFGSDAERAELMDYLDGIMALAGRLGLVPMVFGSPKNRARGSLRMEEALEIATGFFREAGQKARGHGVRLCIEPCPPQYDCDFITTAGEAVDLVERVDDPGFAVHLDAAAMHMVGEDCAAAVAGSIHVLGHVHASEPQLGPLGEGGVDHHALAAALRASGYRGYVSVEMRHVRERDPRAELTRVVALLQEVYGD